MVQAVQPRLMKCRWQSLMKGSLERTGTTRNTGTDEPSARAQSRKYVPTESRLHRDHRKGRTAMNLKVRSMHEKLCKVTVDRRRLAEGTA